MGQPTEPQTAAAATCNACAAALPGGARFCPACGAAAGQGGGGVARGQRPMILVLAVAAVSAAVAVIVAAAFTRTPAPPPAAPPVARGPSPPAPAVGPAASPAAAIDLSAMSPREAADRLFNRVMSADESGDRAEATRFAPMAIAAYARVPDLDADAHFHVGLLHAVLANAADVRREVASLRAERPTHLLADVLEVRLAEQAGDAKAKAATLARLAAAYDAEMATQRSEYEAHRVTIERLRNEAGTGAGKAAAVMPLPPLATLIADPGAKAFATYCASCHGAQATGTDKGPPLVHDYYRPGHHADAAFYLAVRQGVKSHHWSFGDMPPVPGVSDGQIGEIIGFVRKLQVASGIK